MIEYKNLKKLKILRNRPLMLVQFLGRRSLLNWLYAKFYLKLLYKAKTNKKLNIENPQTFNEKLQWLKLYDRNPEYTKMVDKYEVREYIKKKLGEEYMIYLIR